MHPPVTVRTMRSPGDGNLFYTHTSSLLAQPRPRCKKQQQPTTHELKSSARRDCISPQDLIVVHPSGLCPAGLPPSLHIPAIPTGILGFTTTGIPGRGSHNYRRGSCRRGSCRRGSCRRGGCGPRGRCMLGGLEDGLGGLVGLGCLDGLGRSDWLARCRRRGRGNRLLGWRERVWAGCRDPRRARTRRSRCVSPPPTPTRAYSRWS